MKTSFFIRKNGRYIRVDIQDILYIEGCRNYLKIFTVKGTHLVLITFKRMEEILPGALFVRIHKSYIVAIEKMDAFWNDAVLVSNKTLPIGQHYRGLLEKRVTIAAEEIQEKIKQLPVVCRRNHSLAV